MQTARYSLFNAVNVSSVTSLIDAYTIGNASYPAIFNNRVISASYQDLNDTIQIFPVSQYGPGQYHQQTFQVSCRSTTEPKAIEIAQAVYDAVNRSFTNIGYMQATIQPPIKENYSWHVPVEIMYRS